jgi:hypothetical protein
MRNPVKPKECLVPLCTKHSCIAYRSSESTDDCDWFAWVSAAIPL